MFKIHAEKMEEVFRDIQVMYVKLVSMLVEECEKRIGPGAVQLCRYCSWFSGTHGSNTFFRLGICYSLLRQNYRREDELLSNTDPFSSFESY